MWAKKHPRKKYESDKICFKTVVADFSYNFCQYKFVLQLWLIV